jgi:protein-S-isoprenylcysteine O-methyltransferase Ste14
MRRLLGILFGLCTQLFFGVTVWFLFWFLKGEPASSRADFDWQATSLVIDTVLAVQFGVIHSALLHPAVRKRTAGWVSSAFYGCFFCAATCVSLLATIAAWRPVGPVLVELAGWPRQVVHAAFVASWAGLFYSLSLTGLGYQTGWTPWWNWLRGRPAPRREFQPRGAYHVLRHPIYLSFLALIWFTPVWTIDRVLLTGVWTAYVFVGSWLKDERLAFYIGRRYRIYQARVPGYPGFFVGPLAKVRLGRSRTQSPAFIPTCRHALLNDSPARCDGGRRDRVAGRSTAESVRSSA